jgi:hypothetical protein
LKLVLIDMWLEMLRLVVPPKLLLTNRLLLLLLLLLQKLLLTQLLLHHVQLLPRSLPLLRVRKLHKKYSRKGGTLQHRPLEPERPGFTGKTDH